MTMEGITGSPISLTTGDPQGNPMTATWILALVLVLVIVGVLEFIDS